MDIFECDSLKITPEMLKLITEIDEFKGAWQQVGRLSPERLLALKKVATIESIGSSTRIEGVTLSDQQIAPLLSNVDLQNFQTRDEQEVAGYALVSEYIFNNYHSIPLTENAIKQLHGWLLKYTDKDERHRGEYKKIPIRIEAFDPHGKSMGTLFETTSPFQTPIKMQQLIEWTNKSLIDNELHPLIVTGIFVVLFLAIHPFQDGNGRLSRLLTTLLMLKYGYSYTPYSSMESFIETNKETYYQSLQFTQKAWQNNQPDWNPWLIFFLQCLQRQKKHLEVKLEREKSLLSLLPQLSLQVLELLKTHGQLGIAELALLSHANRNTLKKTLSTLVRDNFITRKGNGKSSVYELT